MDIQSTRLSGIPTGFEPLAIQKIYKKKPIIYIVPNETRLSFLQDILTLMTPNIPVLTFSAWDTVPYDRTSPAPEIIGNRIDTLTRLIQEKDKPFLLITTVSALLQKVPAPDFFRQTTCSIQIGQSIPFNELKSFLLQNGYRQSDTVMEAGDYAIRGGLIDLFPAGLKQPIRIDFFGDEVDSIRFFDPITQRTTTATNIITLKPMAEFLLTDKSISLFRSRYRSLFDNQQADGFYESVSAGRYCQGLEHFLPLFHEDLVPLWTYLPQSDIILDAQTPDALISRNEQIQEYYQARCQALTDNTGFGSPYHPIPPEMFFLNTEQISDFLNTRTTFSFSPFIEDGTQDMGGRFGVSFVDTRVQNKQDVFDVLADFISTQKKTVIITASTDGSAQRLSGLIRDKGINPNTVSDFKTALKKNISVLTAPFEKGFSSDRFLLITESDILGDRIIRPVKKKKSPDFIADITTLNIGDLVVHQIHGIGRFAGLMPVQIDGAKHDCLCLEYEDNDKLFVPVENADILSRYGNADNVHLDRLGSTVFVTRKERVKKDLFKMASQLMEIASQRALNKMERILAPHGLYQEFCARFPYSETDDQLRSIQEIESDLASGKPMDRLICGDVGFGKTEVAMRSAFLAVMAGYQVAVIVPTTLLARQHTQNFIQRFQGFPVRIAGLSRLTSAKDRQSILTEMKKGTVDIVIGTHTLLSKGIQFKNLGLVIVDEEQHFGVAHKERLKEIKQGVHVLTLTATPIPRTLQLSLAGVRELSVIATPPVDRLAVKTFVTPFDAVIIKEAILREQFRGGQTFFVCPRISDMKEVADILSKIIPDIRVIQAHGQMPAGKLESIMTAFADKKYDVLLATSIIESGLDMPSVNTMIVYRADMFGLAALYQLRGRVGRGKLKAYAYLTTPARQKISDTAHKRLSVMQSLDSLGAGFTLASHDLDIRGAGNLLGQEQSGHIREIGVALYQKMLSDAIQALRQNKTGNTKLEEDYSPQISVGLPVLIPDTYISDFDVRMGLYHRISELSSSDEIESLRAELLDRFGPYPTEVENLFLTIDLKILAKSVNIERLEAGPKGANISFHKNTFPNPAGLVAYINSQMGTIRIRPDQKLIVMRPWKDGKEKLNGIYKIIKKLSEIAQNG